MSAKTSLAIGARVRKVWKRRQDVLFIVLSAFPIVTSEYALLAAMQETLMYGTKSAVSLANLLGEMRPAAQLVRQVEVHHILLTRIAAATDHTTSLPGGKNQYAVV
jgi:hypothetical protein